MRVKRKIINVAKTAIGRKRGIRKLLIAMGFPDDFLSSGIPRKDLKSIYKHLKKHYIEWRKPHENFS